MRLRPDLAHVLEVGLITLGAWRATLDGHWGKAEPAWAGQPRQCAPPGKGELISSEWDETWGFQQMRGCEVVETSEVQAGHTPPCLTRGHRERKHVRSFISESLSFFFK